MIELVIPDMTCGHCEKTVTKTVHAVDAAAKVEIDLASHRVRIESSHDEKSFSAALADEGYPPAA